MRLAILSAPEDLAALAPEWDDLAANTPSPFLTHAWFTAWWGAFGRGRLFVAALRERNGSLSAAAVLRRTRSGTLTAAANDHAGDWDVVAADEETRWELWRGLAALGRIPVLTVRSLPEDGRSVPLARAALTEHRWRLHATPVDGSPQLDLPGSFDALLRTRSRNLRSQLTRRRRALERRGELSFRTTTGGPSLEADLDALLRIEASGWKGRAGTAIVSDPRAERLYRDFAQAAAERSYLRLQLLELDGQVIAGDLGCVIRGTGFLVKTGFDEAWNELSPGLVLRAEVLASCVAEGLERYDFLGGPDAYKLRWTSSIRPRTTIVAFRGAAGLPAEAYRRALRPALKRARGAARRPSTPPRPSGT